VKASASWLSASISFVQMSQSLGDRDRVPHLRQRRVGNVGADCVRERSGGLAPLQRETWALVVSRLKDRHTNRPTPDPAEHSSAVDEVPRLCVDVLGTKGQPARSEPAWPESAQPGRRLSIRDDRAIFSVKLAIALIHDTPGSVVSASSRPQKPQKPQSREALAAPAHGSPHREAGKMRTPTGTSTATS
jgi:hypothetical protein